MFMSGRWRSEKKKIKIVFKLQFNATQVSELKAEGLTISLVPGDVSKPTVKAEKAMVLDGHCRWESPVSETVKFVQDVKTGKVNHRIYHLILSTTGSTKSGLVGETSIDFAEYVDAFNTCNVSLPLRNSISKAMLHVSVQRQLENVDLQRVVKESDTLVKRSSSQDLKSQLSIEAKCDSQEEGPFGKASRIGELRRRASVESDSTLSRSFDSVSEVDTLAEFGCRGDHSTLPHHLDTNVYHEEPPHVSESEWSGSSDQGIRTNEDMNSSNDRDTSRISSDDDEVDKLKAELFALTRRADLSELELQSLRKQIVKETKRSQDLLREVTSLKLEREKRKEDANVRNKLQSGESDPQVLLEELQYEKDLSSSLRIQLEKTQESNTELNLAVQDLEAMLRQRRIRPTEEPRRELCISETDEDEDQKALDELVKGHMDAKEAHVLERRITDLYNEIEIHKRDKDDLEIHVEQENHKLEQSQAHEQLKMQYECSSSSLENQIESLEAKLKNQSEDFSESLCRIKELETQMEEELEKQAQIFEADIEAVTLAKVEQEQRAVEAEEALRKSRWRNANVAGKIQDEFKRISEQMSFTLAANEKMSKKAIAETRDLRMEKRQLEELLMKANDELRANKEKYEAKLIEMEKESESLAEELQEMHRMKDEKETVFTLLKSEVEIVRGQCDDLKHSLSKNESENEQHRSSKERIILLEEHIKLKENALEASSKMFSQKEKELNNRIEELESKLNKISPNSLETGLHGPEADIALQNREVNKSDDLKDLVNEVASLKEQNGVMEMELKEMQERYSDISVRFAEVEGERQRLVMTVRNLKNAKRS